MVGKILSSRHSFLILATVILTSCRGEQLCQEAPSSDNLTASVSYRLSSHPIEVLSVTAENEIIAIGAIRPPATSGSDISHTNEQIIWHNADSKRSKSVTVGPIKAAHVAGNERDVIVLSNDSLLQYAPDAIKPTMLLQAQAGVADFVHLESGILLAGKEELLFYDESQSTVTLFRNHKGGRLQLCTDETTNTAWYLRKLSGASYLGRITIGNALEVDEVQLPQLGTGIDVTTESVFVMGLAYLFQHDRESLQLEKKYFTQGVGGGDFQMSDAGRYAVVETKGFAIYDTSSQQIAASLNLEKTDCLNAVTSVYWDAYHNQAVAGFLNGWVTITKLPPVPPGKY